MFKLPIFIITWILFFLFSTIMIVIGWLLIPIQAYFYNVFTVERKSYFFDKTIRAWKYKFMYPWGNEEDGIVAGDEYKDKPMWFRIIYWSANRNPVNNLRFIKLLTCQLDPTKIQYIANFPKHLDGSEPDIGHPFMYDSDNYRFISLTWQGIFSNLRIQFKMNGAIWRFWIGWKIYPHDQLGILSTDYRIIGAGFATQFKRIYPRG